MILSLLHGNEISGALALTRMLEGGLRPNAGSLSLIFANVAAFERFDPARPRNSRFVDEDMNRLWDDRLYQRPALTCERRRARELLPILERADFVLDLHSMYSGTVPLMLSGWGAAGRELAARVGAPSVVVADRGHEDGRRLIDWANSAEGEGRPAAVLLEAGQHWARSTARTAFDISIRFLQVVGSIDDESAGAFSGSVPPGQNQRLVEVTDVVTVTSTDFAFVRPFGDLEVIDESGTVIAHEAGRMIRTPYDACVLVMPTNLPRPGLTAVRLGRFVSLPVF
ncbi:M14 family metallopeptidase [Arboricoccus pini]|uniref:succinylglutamate desuccinylase/aspartoacylase domain-containing protein n=1 Tax=Arboricoccus pini TaxID=1963835 RepID=UPI001FAEED8A|nr:succinylglutamate desuccinylase/aspartoacylase family protein [Arboricoccus pini]